MSARRSSGFTLIELLVAMALGTILVGVTSFIFMSARRVYDQSLAEIATSNELRAGFDRIGRDLYDVQVLPTTTWELKVVSNDDSTHGPDDTLDFVTLERTELAAAVPIRVRLKLGARDGDGLAPLVRTVTHRGLDAATGQIIDVGDTDQILLGRVRAFMVEYAWPSQGVPGPTVGSNAGQEFLRGPGVGPWIGPSPSSGARFVYSSEGTFANGLMTISGAKYDTSPRHAPRHLARMMYVKYDAAASPKPEHAFPVLEVQSDTKIRVVGAADGDADFWIPLQPKAFKVTIRHEGRNGPRSVTEILKSAP